MKKVIILSCLLVFSLTLAARPERITPKRVHEVFQFKTRRFLRLLELSGEQEAAVQAVFKQHEQAVVTAGFKHRQLLQSLAERGQEQFPPLDKLIPAFFEVEKELLDAKKKLSIDLLKLLPPEQVLQFLIIDKKVDQFLEHHGPRRPPGRRSPRRERGD